MIIVAGGDSHVWGSELADSPHGGRDGDILQPIGFYQWAIENKYSIGVDGHPLEKAHREAALLIKEKFDEMVKKFI